MIDQADVQKVCGQVITASGLFPRIVWANRDALPAKPYLVLNLRPSGIRDRTLRQDSPTWTGELICTVVTGLNEFDTVAQGLVASLAALFPAASRLTLSSGQKLLVPTHPRQQPGYRDGSYYRMPLSIPLQSD